MSTQSAFTKELTIDGEDANMDGDAGISVVTVDSKQEVVTLPSISTTLKHTDLDMIGPDGALITSAPDESVTGVITSSSSPELVDEKEKHEDVPISSLSFMSSSEDDDVVMADRTNGKLMPTRMTKASEDDSTNDKIEDISPLSSGTYLLNMCFQIESKLPIFPCNKE